MIRRSVAIVVSRRDVLATPLVVGRGCTGRLTSLAVIEVGASTMFNGRVRTEQSTDPVQTTRLVLTPVGAGDVGNAMVLHRDAAIALWTGPWTQSTTGAWVADMVERWTVDGVGKWLAHDRSDGSLVGRGGFTLFDLNGEIVLELGWAVRDHLTRRGYATEIGEAALEWAAVFFPQLPVISFTEVHNIASRTVMRHLGMRDADVIHREGLIAGRPGLHPDAPFALYRSA